MTNRVVGITSSSIFLAMQGLLVLATIAATGAKNLFLVARIPNNLLAELQGSTTNI